MSIRSSASSALSLRSAASAAFALLGLTLALVHPAHAGEQRTASRAGSATPVTIAHRGASGYAPENTLAAVEKAHALGVDWVETDVQRTRDGELVIMHDTTLDRTTNAEQLYPDRSPWKVGDFTAAEIARLDAGSWYGRQYAGERVPTLEQYVEKVEGNRQKLLLELKSPALYPGVENQTLKVLSNEGWLDSGHVHGKLVVQSFDANAVRTVHELAPEVRTGFLGSPRPADLAGYAGYCDEINPPYASVTSDYVEAVHAQKGPHGRPLQLFTWTVNDAGTAREVAGEGVDGVISNYPDVVRDAMSG
jgi:glycerophosphoryl diester phosphodiesterase